MDEQKILHTRKLVEELTDIYTKKQYPGWNRRKRKAKEAERLSKTSSEAQTIKYADIIDNYADIKNSKEDFARLFLFECRSLLKTITEGDNRLYKKLLRLWNSVLKSKANNIH
jgi:predicted RNA-binding protein with EMAP domain